MRPNKRIMKLTAVVLLLAFSLQLIIPNRALALTTGPSQPEVQSFEPVGTTDMVDMFSGSFVYNIPLLDVEGYPVNISYHGGATMEQEASWVGLGWNINPGVINRTVRGLPDDFNGNTITKELHIKDEKTLRVGLGAGLEASGWGDPYPGLSANVGANLNISNYRGVSCDFSFGAGVSLLHTASLGVNIGVGSQTGAEIDYNRTLSLSSAMFLGDDMGGVSFSKGQGYNLRSGIKTLHLGVSAHVGKQQIFSIYNNVPIGLQNYVPVITNSNTMSSIAGRLKIGGEFTWFYGYGTINAMFSKVHYNDDGSRPGYGYFNLQNAPNDYNSILDFTRDKDGMFNKTMAYLPPASMTYDIYSISGQGTGGVYRPYRNDFGSVYDPTVSSNQESESYSAEVGIGNMFEAGVDYSKFNTDITSGPWMKYHRPFSHDSVGLIYESFFFKQAGELTETDNYLNTVGGMGTVDPDFDTLLPDSKPGALTQRDPKANLLYISNGGPSQIGGLTQVQKDGKRYIYGYPVYNHIQKEATFNVHPPTPTDLAAGLVDYTPGTDDGPSNNIGLEQYYSSTITPEYAHAFLLTSVLSTDYVDVGGDGPSDDDLGSFTTFHYTRKSKDYRWKAPFPATKAQYDPGHWCEPRDDKGSYMIGSRDEVILDKIESKNYVAQFYTSPRADACGSTEIVINGIHGTFPYDSPLHAPTPSYELDSIRLYNKHDFNINGSAAVPIKTVFFVYDYSLCQGIPNTLTPGSGKLTLRKIYFRYGNSQKSLLSPYQFDYGNNPDYDAASKDRWGDYKPSDPTCPNYEFPFVDQSDPSKDTYASSWSLNKITLPSGGVIQAEYESNDYAYVQNQQAMEMFKINGIGSSPNFSNGHQLYRDKNSPYLYAYFTRRLSAETGSFAKNYAVNGGLVYYNFNVKLTGKKTSHEQVKGYSIAGVGPCPDGIHGYIQFSKVTPKGGGAAVNPVTFTALNVGRYSVPQIIFPGSDPDESDLDNILAGLKDAFGELVGIGRSPIVRLIKKNDAKDVDLNKSYIRLLSPGGHKKGGGQRVKQLTFNDSWHALTGGNSQVATYGKQYDYTTNDPALGTVSSGVASYEPLIGGDENPFRQPIKYVGASGNNWPPNDPVDLYQENPIGESLFPSASVGYSKVTVKSINQSAGRSSQGVDIYQFYTSKDFPVETEATALGKDPQPEEQYDLFTQKNTLTVTQGYVLKFNDMHGKARSVEHYVYERPSGTLKLISSQVYNYRQSGGKLDNSAPCLVYAAGVGMVPTTRQLGIEADYTIDSREKKEHTKNHTVNGNFNIAAFGPVVLPVVTIFPWNGDYRNEFRSATVTKVIQQYGILDNVISNNEGAITTLKNEYFDPQTGNVVVTSVNNEFHDKEYTTNVPAYWCYNGMGPAYTNINYQFDVRDLYIDSNNVGMFPSPGYLNVGDEVQASYIYDKRAADNLFWVIGSGMVGDTADSANSGIHYSLNHLPPGFDTTMFRLFGPGPVCMNYVIPRFPSTGPYWNHNVVVHNLHMQVTRSGPRNMLGEPIETYTSLGNPVSALLTSLGNVNLINLSARKYCDSNTAIDHKYVNNPDFICPYAIGERGIFREMDEYAYVANRSYSGTSARNSGLFRASDLFWPNPLDPHGCVHFPYNYLKPASTISDEWKVRKTITKVSPFGQEIENLDAVGNYSTALFDYNQSLPTAVAVNAKQGDIMSNGFEKYAILHPTPYLMNRLYNPFDTFFATTTLGGSIFYDIFKQVNPGGLSSVQDFAHTGKYSLLVDGAKGSYANAYSVPLNFAYTGRHSSKYNLYYNYPADSFKESNEYLPFQLVPGKRYVLSYWIFDPNAATNPTSYTLSSNWGVEIGASVLPVHSTTNIIENWQQVELTFTVPITATSALLNLPAHYYVDDIRIYPADGNMKSFVYSPVNEKLMATLDENNFATFYEYDQEGNLVRTKKETERGIMTISESRSGTSRQ